MSGQMCILMAVFIPFIGAFILPILGVLSIRVRNFVSLLLVLTSFVMGLLLIPLIIANQLPEVVLNLDLGFLGVNGTVFRADGLAVLMSLVSSFVGSIIVFYSWGYISHYENQNEYYLMVVLFLASMIGLVFSTNLIFLFVFWEITAITCWRLIGFFREPNHVLKADKAFLVTVFGALVMLLGFIMIFQQYHTFDLTKIPRGSMINDTAMLLILAGIFSKSATLPFHTWLPDAGVAPSPVTSLLHAAVLVKIGVYVYARLFVVTFNINHNWNIISSINWNADWSVIVSIIAGISALVSAGAAVIETDLKRIIAYSTVSQLGFIFLGLAIGSPLAYAGGLIYILMHGLAKGGLFLCAGIVEQNAKSKDITKLGGLITTMPVTAVTFMICAFSIMGIPPFGGFFSKYMVIGGTVDAGHPWIALTFIIGAVLTVIYLLRVFVMVFLGPAKLEAPVKEGSMTMLVSVSLLAFFSIIGGLMINYITDFVQIIITGVIG